VIEDMRLAADDMQNWLLSRYKQWTHIKSVTTTMIASAATSTREIIQLFSSMCMDGADIK
jgi:hypothetical protein